MYPVIDIGILRIPSFGAMLAIGFGSVLLFLGFQSRKFGYRYRTLHIATLWAFAAGALGSRIIYMILVNHTLNLGELQHLEDGTMFYGFLIGAAITSILYLKFTRLEVAKVLDICVPAWATCQIFGRVGCFLAGCCYGLPTDLPWGVKFTHPLVSAPKGVTLHPTQLYEALWVLLIVVALFVFQNRKTFQGEVTILYLGFYSALRFLIEFLRNDYRGSFFGGFLSTSQTISVVILPLCVVLFVVLKRLHRLGAQF